MRMRFKEIHDPQADEAAGNDLQRKQEEQRAGAVTGEDILLKSYSALASATDKTEQTCKTCLVVSEICFSSHNKKVMKSNYICMFVSQRHVALSD